MFVFSIKKRVFRFSVCLVLNILFFSACCYSAGVLPISDYIENEQKAIAPGMQTNTNGGTPYSPLPNNNSIPINEQNFSKWQVKTGAPTSFFGTENQNNNYINEQNYFSDNYYYTDTRTPQDIIDRQNYERMDGMKDYVGTSAMLDNYYQSLKAKNNVMAGHHEENYIYRTGERSISYYDGLLTHIIKDFDNDTFPEMAVFTIKTNGVNEYSNKDIILDIYDVMNGAVYLVDSMILNTEQYLGESIDCEISVKYVNENWRIFLNYFEHKVLDNFYQSKLIAVDLTNENLNIISTLDFSGYEDDYGMYDNIDDVIDAGVNVIDDTDVHKKAFLNDDIYMIPVFSIKRVNEKIRDNYLDEYFEQYAELDQAKGYKLRYGYTNFVDRVR